MSRSPKFLPNPSVSTNRLFSTEILRLNFYEYNCDEMCRNLFPPSNVIKSSFIYHILNYAMYPFNGHSPVLKMQHFSLKISLTRFSGTCCIRNSTTCRKIKTQQIHHGMKIHFSTNCTKVNKITIK